MLHYFIKNEKKFAIGLYERVWQRLIFATLLTFNISVLVYVTIILYTFSALYFDVYSK